MGCCASAPHKEYEEVQIADTKRPRLRRPKWASDEPMTRSQLQKMRDEFWDTQPHYGGNHDMWLTLRLACEQDELEAAQAYLDAAEMKVACNKMSKFYDAQGFMYELPPYVAAAPTNLVTEH